MKISVLGSGGWGTALAMLCCKCSHETVLWGKFSEEIENLKKTGANPLLKGVELPKKIKLTSNNEDIKNSDIIIIATPSFAVAETAEMLKSIVDKKTIIVSVAKGFCKENLKRFSLVISEILPNNPVVVLSGPSHAEEVAREIPTSIVASSVNQKAAEVIQEALSNDFFRIYTNNDVVGVETGAALKNVIAVAAGIIDGLGLGDNTIAALITRGIAEISRLGEAMGGKPETFAGLSGLGDLIVTCTSVHSRNRRFGKMLGEGANVEEALKGVGMTVEGYFAADAAKRLADQYKVEMPIVNEGYKILYQGMPPKAAIKNLMNRTKKAE